MEFSLEHLQPKERASFALRSLYETAGCRKYHMGRFEEYSLYQENRSFLSSEQVITFTDLDGRLLALKPDVTLSIFLTDFRQFTSTTQQGNFRPHGKMLFLTKLILPEKSEYAAVKVFVRGIHLFINVGETHESGMKTTTDTDIPFVVFSVNLRTCRQTKG